MTTIGIDPELKKKIMTMEYNCLTKGYDTVSKEEKELVGNDYGKIKNYYFLSQKYLPFPMFNNIRGDFGDDFFDSFDDIIKWFRTRARVFDVVLIPSYHSISFILKLNDKGLRICSYTSYWYKLLDNETFSSFNKNNIVEVTDDLAEVYAETVLKHLQIEPEDQLYNEIYNLFKIGCKLPNFKNFLYKIDEEFVGTGILAMDEDWGLLYYDTIDPEYQEQHIREELVNYRLDYAKSKEIKHVIVTTGLDGPESITIQKMRFQHAFTAEHYSSEEIENLLYGYY